MTNELNTTERIVKNKRSKQYHNIYLKGYNSLGKVYRDENYRKISQEQLKANYIEG